MTKEPAILTGLVVALLGALIHWLDLPALDSDTAETVANVVITLAGALVVRAKVMPVATIKEAGLSPKAVEARAEDPEILAHRGE